MGIFGMKKILVCIIVFMILITPMETFGKTDSVEIGLPTFQVVFNGEKIENNTRTYPLITYKGITYFPMTYYDARFLGLETSWNQNSGLKVYKTDVSGGYRTYSGKTENTKTDYATIPTFKIEINGKLVDNTKEIYPLLSYKNITYFPMTWRWAVGEFKWKYTFDVKKGLSIQSDKTVKRTKSLYGINSDAFIFSEGYCYYSDGKAIYQKSIVNNGMPAKKVYELELWSYGEDSNSRAPHSLYKEDGNVMLKYHQGGAIMGYDVYIQLNSDGSHEEIASGYLLYKRINDFIIEAYQGPGPYENNMTMEEKDGTIKNIGNPDYIYGWFWHTDESGNGGEGSRDIYLLNDDLYIMAFNMKQDTDASRIHRVNLTTNETERVSNLITYGFKADGGNLYCISGGQLYEISLISAIETKFDTKGLIEQYEALNGRIYYINSEQKLYQAGKDESINALGKAITVYKENNYITATFAEESNNPYRLIVIDSQGNIVYRTADVVLDMVGIENGRLYYVENYTRNIYSVDLK